MAAIHRDVLSLIVTDEAFIMKRLNHSPRIEQSRLCNRTGITHLAEAKIHQKVVLGGLYLGFNVLNAELKTVNSA